MTAKLPAFQFYPGDWLKDPALSMCAPATRGVWIDLLCAMHETRTGTVAGTLPQLARLCRCAPEDISEALTDLISTRTAEVQYQAATEKGVITITSRRLKREAKLREEAAARQRKSRGKSDEKKPPVTDCHTPVTDAQIIEPFDVAETGETLSQNCHNASSSSSSISIHSVTKVTGGEAPPRADVIWDLGVNLLRPPNGWPNDRAECAARSFLGRLAKDHGKGALALAIATTSAAAPVEPREYLVKVLQGGINARNQQFGQNTGAGKSANGKARIIASKPI